MELRHLRYFRVLAQTLNFTRAAEQLHIAQPPLSRQIRQLEETLGVELLERGRPLRLTEAGRFFHEQSAALLDQLEQIAEGTRRIANSERQWLRIGFAPSTLYDLLPELIRQLRRNEEMELGLQEMITLQQVEALKAGRIDVGFGRIHIKDPAIEQVLLREEPLVVALPCGHPLLGQPLDLKRLADEPFVLYPANPRPSYADHIMALFTAQGVNIKVIQWTNELQTALGLVAAGLGITLVPASVQSQHRADIVYAPLPEKTAVSPIILSRRAGDNSPQVRQCLSLVAQMNTGPQG
ncbi:LysR family transcriptional regulator [Pseudomonas wadenswilerensis]|jgi:DNA-binding transcriptional LysR family regulator|uniref:LysR family transcriptional regulator n=1 Tax=Pseudomonas TaxID=286 RepID=UPI000FBE3F4A|nr:LysR family transcriptional regulator [Pseudomonas sp. JV241A]SPO69841.1 HTH-type transcriptional regulator CatR [Pseudomonas sp. JV241A]